MKIIPYFFFVLSVAVLINTPTDAMKRVRPTATTKLRCSHLPESESIEVPERLIKHSGWLYSCFMKLPFASEYLVKVADQLTLCAIVDCLKIIDAGQEVENKLLSYLYDFVVKYTEESALDNLLNAVKYLKIQSLDACFYKFPNYYAQRNINERLNVIIQEAKDIFAAIEDKEHSAIIIDIDDTALSRVTSSDKIIVNGIVTNFPYFPALKQVRDLYKQIVDLGFKVFFLTARVEKSSPNLDVCDAHQATVQNLKEEGYDVFEQVICVPYEARQQMRKDSKGDDDLFVDLHAQWKESERNKIAEKFAVVGTLDDIKENLQGKNVGHAVLIPRFV